MGWQPGKTGNYGNVAQPGSAVGTKDGPGIDLALGTTTQQAAGSNPAIPARGLMRFSFNPTPQKVKKEWQPEQTAMHGGQCFACRGLQCSKGRHCAMRPNNKTVRREAGL